MKFKNGNRMWFRRYKDYEIDQPLIKDQVSSGNGIIGCEMHELNGWGDTIHRPSPVKSLENKEQKGPKGPKG